MATKNHHPHSENLLNREPIFLLNENNLSKNI